MRITAGQWSEGRRSLYVPVDTLERIPFGRFALMMSVNGTAIAAATIICIIRGLRAGGLALLALGRAPPPWPFAPDMLMMLLEGLQCANASRGEGAIYASCGKAGRLLWYLDLCTPCGQK